jgi:hypothetical protein
MKLMTVGKVAGAIAGTTGAGSMAVLAGALVRITAMRAVPTAMWALMAGLITVTAAVTSLALVLDYRKKKLEIESAAEMEKARQEMYRVVLEKSAGEPRNAEAYRELIIADALHLALERNGVQPADQTHGYLYGHGLPGSGPAGVSA